MDLRALRLRQGTKVRLEEAHREMLARAPPTDMVFEKSWRSRTVHADCEEEEDIVEGLSLSRWFLDLCRSVVVSCNSWRAKKQASQRNRPLFPLPCYFCICVYTCGMHVPVCTHTCEGQRRCWVTLPCISRHSLWLNQNLSCHLVSAASLLWEFPVFMSSSVLRHITRLFCQPCPLQ